MNNRLKLYDDSIYTYLNHRDKVKFRKLAFKHKKTVSEFNRLLIQFVIKLNEKSNLNSKLNKEDVSLIKILDCIGGTTDK